MADGEDEEDAQEPAEARPVDQHGFMVSSSGSPVMPAWEVDHTKQMQRLRKWRNMLGGCTMWHCQCVSKCQVHP